MAVVVIDIDTDKKTILLTKSNGQIEQHSYSKQKYVNLLKTALLHHKETVRTSSKLIEKLYNQLTKA
jgi:hypothetical protein